MSVMIRPAVPEDATSLTGVINPIIAAGGTTAHQTPFDPSRLLRHYIAPPGIVSCQVALLDDQPVGMQSLQWPDDEGDPFPEGWAIIASFVSPAAAGRGIGRALFAATANAAQAAGVQTAPIIRSGSLITAASAFGIMTFCATFPCATAPASTASANGSTSSPDPGSHPAPNTSGEAACGRGQRPQ